MITWHLSKTGFEVPVIDGQVLASRYDPLKEATRFLTIHEAALTNIECVFLVGAGNPLIVQELLHAHSVSAVIVIDSHAELIQSMKERHQSDLVQWICISSFDELESLECLRKFFQMKFRVLVAPSSQFLPPAWLQDSVDFLNGHSVPGFFFQLSLRSPTKGPTGCHILPEIDGANFGKVKALQLIKSTDSPVAHDGITKILAELIL
jgi:hypothetical protein